MATQQKVDTKRERGKHGFILSIIDRDRGCAVVNDFEPTCEEFLDLCASSFSLPSQSRFLAFSLLLFFSSSFVSLLPRCACTQSIARTENADTDLIPIPRAERTQKQVDNLCSPPYFRAISQKDHPVYNTACVAALGTALHSTSGDVSSSEKDTWDSIDTKACLQSQLAEGEQCGDDDDVFCDELSEQQEQYQEQHQEQHQEQRRRRVGKSWYDENQDDADTNKERQGRQIGEREREEEEEEQGAAVGKEKIESAEESTQRSQPVLSPRPTTASTKITPASTTTTVAETVEIQVVWFAVTVKNKDGSSQYQPFKLLLGQNIREETRKFLTKHNLSLHAYESLVLASAISKFMETIGSELRIHNPAQLVKISFWNSRIRKSLIVLESAAAAVGRDVKTVVEKEVCEPLEMSKLDCDSQIFAAAETIWTLLHEQLDLRSLFLSNRQYLLSLSPSSAAATSWSSQSTTASSPQGREPKYAIDWDFYLSNRPDFLLELQRTTGLNRQAEGKKTIEQDFEKLMDHFDAISNMVYIGHSVNNGDISAKSDPFLVLDPKSFWLKDRNLLINSRKSSYSVTDSSQFYEETEQESAARDVKWENEREREGNSQKGKRTRGRSVRVVREELKSARRNVLEEANAVIADESGTHVLQLIHIPKTGGTSIKTAMGITSYRLPVYALVADPLKLRE